MMGFIRPMVRAIVNVLAKCKRMPADGDQISVYCTDTDGYIGDYRVSQIGSDLRMIEIEGRWYTIFVNGDVGSVTTGMYWILR